MPKPQHWVRSVVVSVFAGLCLHAYAAEGATEASIRQNLKKLLPELPPVTSVNPTPMTGLYELVINGQEVLYTDSKGRFLIQGALLDLNDQRNLTEERIEKLSAIAFDALPLKDAFKVVRGKGTRQLAVFSDPNCGFCKRLEKSLADDARDVTLHVFLYPILNADSVSKSKAIWCAKDKAKAWDEWMQKGVAPKGPANCDTSAIDRNIALGQSKMIRGTPTLVFPNGARVPGAIPVEEIERRLRSAS